ncbi:MAG: hypothetical protein WCF03_20050 [Nitrososphaeraceae archaeon]
MISFSALQVNYRLKMIINLLKLEITLVKEHYICANLQLMKLAYDRVDGS